MAQMTAKSINDLPDSDFAYIESGGEKDEDGKTVPRSLRHFPIHDAAHVRNALARASQSPFGKQAMPKILAAAKKFGIEVSGDRDMPNGGIPRGLPLGVAIRAAEFMPVLTAYQRNNVLESRLSSHYNNRLELRGMTDIEAHVHGYSTVYDVPYAVAGGPPYGWNEVVRSGATQKSIKERDDVRLLINHTGLPIARTKPGTMTLMSDGVGQLMDARVDLRSTTTRDVVLAMDRGDVDEMSFSFEVTKQKWNSDYTEREIFEVKQYDNSIVTYPASPTASVYIKQDADPNRSLRNSVPLSLARAQAEALRLGR
jgi:HK97 family phage prohead protease